MISYCLEALNNPVMITYCMKAPLLNHIQLPCDMENDRLEATVENDQLLDVCVSVTGYATWRSGYRWMISSAALIGAMASAAW
jgi:hypothetical protein